MVWGFQTRGTHQVCLWVKRLQDGAKAPFLHHGMGHGLTQGGRFWGEDVRLAARFSGAAERSFCSDMKSVFLALHTQVWRAYLNASDYSVTPSHQVSHTSGCVHQ